MICSSSVYSSCIITLTRNNYKGLGFYSQASNRQIKVSRKIKIWHELLRCKTKIQLTSLSENFLDVPLWRQKQPPLIILLSRALQENLIVIPQKYFPHSKILCTWSHCCESAGMTWIFGIFEYFSCFTHWKWLNIAAHNNSLPDFQAAFWLQMQKPPSKRVQKSLTGVLHRFKDIHKFGKSTCNLQNYSNFTIIKRMLQYRVW